MNTQKANPPDRIERIERGMLGLALLGGVVWAMTFGNTFGTALL